MVSAWPPAWLISPATLSRASGFLLTNIHLAPWAARALAMDSPIPRLAPVINAILSVSEKSTIRVSFHYQTNIFGSKDVVIKGLINEPPAHSNKPIIRFGGFCVNLKNRAIVRFFKLTILHATVKFQILNPKYQKNPKFQAPIRQTTPFGIACCLEFWLLRFDYCL